MEDLVNVALVPISKIIDFNGVLVDILVVTAIKSEFPVGI
jgi:hypothetical protein